MDSESNGVFEGDTKNRPVEIDFFFHYTRCYTYTTCLNLYLKKKKNGFSAYYTIHTLYISLLEAMDIF